MQLRPYQQETLQAIVDNYKAGIRHQLVVWSTGTGKTCLAANLPRILKDLLPGRLLFIAHRDELLFQTIETFHEWAPELKVGLEKAEHRAALDCDVVVACNASIGREGSTRMERFNWDTFSIIVCDEAHHILGQSFLNILEDSGVLREDSRKLLLGITATPRRMMRTRDKQQVTLLDDEDLISLKSVFKKIVYSYPLRTAIKDKYLVPLKGYRVSTDTSLDGVKVTAGDFQTEALSAVVNNIDRNTLAVKAWKDYAEGRQTVCFTTDVHHAKDMSEVFMQHGVLSQPIYGDDPQRAEKLKWHESGKIQVLTNCALLCEGYNSPSVSCVILARPTKSGTLMTQQVGRGTRLYPGKEDCLVIDLCDNTRKNSIVTFPSLLGLNPAFDLHGQCAITAVEKLEELQEKHVGIDFSNLTDLSRVKAYVESVDLLSDPLAPEVKELTTLAWQSSQDGSYIINIPENQEISQAKQFWLFQHERLNIVQNELEELVLSITSVDQERQLGIFNTLPEAFKVADDVLRRCRPDRLKLMLRESPWHSFPASDASKKYLKRLLSKRSFGYCTCPVSPSTSGKAGEVCGACKKPQLTAGQASIAITKLKVKVK